MISELYGEFYRLARQIGDVTEYTGKELEQTERILFDMQDIPTVEGAGITGIDALLADIKGTASSELTRQKVYPTLVIESKKLSNSTQLSLDLYELSNSAALRLEYREQNTGDVLFFEKGVVSYAVMNGKHVDCAQKPTTAMASFFDHASSYRPSVWSGGDCRPFNPEKEVEAIRERINNAKKV